MVNQLIQRKDKPPIVKTKEEITYKITVSLEQRLSEGFEKLEHQRGIKVLNNLKEEHDTLQKLFDNPALNESIVDAQKIQSLTNSLYSQGLQFLSSAYESAQQFNSIDVSQIESEISELDNDLQSASDMLKSIILERIEKNKKALETVKGYKERVEEHLCQVGLCRDSIREIRLELPELLSHKSKDDYDKILLELNTRISLAQRVKAEYDKQGL